MRLTPVVEEAQKIATLFRRRLTTAWSPKEISTFKRLRKSGAFADLDLVIRYYMAERKKGEKGIHRRDLDTFLNRFTGEVDRAREWEERNRPKRPRQPVVSSSRVNATGHTIATEIDPVVESELEPISDGVKKFMKDYEQYKKGKGKS